MAMSKEKSYLSRAQRTRIIQSLKGRTFRVNIVGAQVLTLNLTLNHLTLPYLTLPYIKPQILAFLENSPTYYLFQVFEKGPKRSLSILVKVTGLEEIRSLLGYPPPSYKLRQHVTIATHCI